MPMTRALQIPCAAFRRERFSIPAPRNSLWTRTPEPRGAPSPRVARAHLV